MIIAGISFVASVVSAGYAAVAYMSSTTARDRLLRQAPASLPIATASQPVLLTTALITPLGRHGMDASQRSAIVDAIKRRIEMTQEQAQELDALLAEDGNEIFNLTPGESLSDSAVLQQLGDQVGRLPAADGSEPFFFETPAGRAEIYNSRALFYRHNALTPIRAAAGRRTNASGHPILIAADVDALAELIQEACTRTGKPLNEAQAQKVRALLSDPEQQIVSVTSTPDGNQLGLNSAQVQSDGYATIDFSGGALTLGPRGNVVLRSDASSIPVVSGAACALVAVESLVSIGMAVFLLIICLGLFRQSRPRLTSLKRWSIGKIALALIAGVVIAWLTDSYLTHSITESRAQPKAGVVPLMIGLVVAILGCAYPAAVLFVSRSRSVREYDGAASGV